MNPGLAFFIMLNNYFHDIATALLLASGIAVWMLRKQDGVTDNLHIGTFIRDSYRSMAKLATVALIWVSLGAIPRILAFTRLEWPSAFEKNQLSGLAAKHILAFIIIVCGTCLWISISRSMKVTARSSETPESDNP
ncbi:MAG: hypothetical protein C0402_16855 [Thermodesulfovibrio sp.]|nr:hypothetical protein [Thermodesulfovibrio sp.]